MDDTGRRHRLVRLIGWVVGGLTLAYLTLLGISLVGSPGLVPLSLPAIGSVLPGPSAPQIADATKVTRNPGELVPGDPRTTSLVTGGAPSQSPLAPRAVRSTPAAGSTPRPTRSAAPRPVASPTASPAHTPQGNPSPAGTPRSPSAHPSPKSTHASPHDMKASPTPSPT